MSILMKLDARRVFNIAIYAIVFSVIGLFVMQLVGGGVLAQVVIPDIDNPVEGNLLDFVQNTLNVVIGLSALVAVGILVYSGIMYITAAGDEGKISNATKGITWAIIGLIICFISVLIVNFVLTTILGQPEA